MILNQHEYKVAVARLQLEKRRLEQQVERLQAMDLAPGVVSRVMESLESSYAQLAEDVGDYEQSTEGVAVPIDGLGNLGTALIGMRIAQNLSQQELADRLEVDRKAISRSEHCQYRGLTLERAVRILAALGVELRLEVVSKESAAA